MIEAIASAIAQTSGCSLLDVDPGASTNRTVYTFVGSPEAVVEGAMNAARAAYQLIDMRLHQGMCLMDMIEMQMYHTLACHVLGKSTTCHSELILVW